MNSHQSLLIYYIVKRSYLFMDEWLFYYVLYKLFKSEHYKIMTIVCLYGLSCIYTSYSNIEKIENKLTGMNQMVWYPLDYIKNKKLI